MHDLELKSAQVVNLSAYRDMTHVMRNQSPDGVKHFVCIPDRQLDGKGLIDARNRGGAGLVQLRV